MLRRVLILALGLGVVAWWAVLFVRNRELRTELHAAKSELGVQRLSEAKARLVRLAERTARARRRAVLARQLRAGGRA